MQVISPDNQIYLNCWGTQTPKQGRRGRPEEVISQINHFSCTLQERQTSKKRLLDTRGTWKARRSHLPDQSIFLVLLRATASSQSHLEIIICCLPREEKKHLKYRRNSRPKCSERELATRSLCRVETLAHRRPQPARARSGRNVVPATVNRKITTRASNFHHSGTSKSVDRKRSSGLDRMHLSRTSAPCHSESQVVGGSADALTRRWRGKRPSRRLPGRARGEKQGCTERRFFPLRA